MTHSKDRQYLGVSACLLGVNCKYNGSNNLNLKVLEYAKGYEIIRLCPEVFGGMPTPRIPCEIQDNGTIINKNGEDMTKHFNLGKEKTLELLKKYNCKKVVLKNGSPSCGYTTIYDGSFTNKLINGQGVTTKYLIENEIDIIDLET